MADDTDPDARGRRGGLEALAGATAQAMPRPATECGAPAAAPCGAPAAAPCGATLASGRPCAWRSRAEHPELGPLCGVHLRSAERGRAECSICLDVLKPRARERLQCGHGFHRRCIRKWCRSGAST